MDFAGNVVLIEECKTALQDFTNMLINTMSKAGLRINTDKCEVIAINCDVNQEIVKEVDENFRYLGSAVIIDRSASKNNIRIRIEKVNDAFSQICTQSRNVEV